MTSATTTTGVLITESFVGAGMPGTVRASDRTICVVCVAGTGTLRDGAQTFRVRPGLMVIRMPRWAGEFRADRERMRLVSFAWRSEHLSALGPLAAGLEAARTYYGRSSVELAWRAAGEIAISDPYTPRALQLFSDGVALGLARGLLYGDRREPALAARASALIRQSTRPPQLGHIARQLGCSTEHLSRAFRSAYGVSPTAFILRHRIEQAREPLATSTKSIAAVARSLGFHDASHFARHFRKLMGITPRQFRIRQREIKTVPE